jgi:hypothetical protein
MRKQSTKITRGLMMALLLGLLLSVSNMPTAAAQDGPGFDDNVADVPVDGGLGLLMAAGVAYGVSRRRRRL